ncbi:MAG: MarC family protein, partial [Proteobacteria bacterium]|nr:MarC family protein [Pseudomonadota bacterium]
AVVLLIANTEGDRVQYAAVLAAIAAILLLTFLLMLIAVQLQKLLGVTGAHVVSRIVGVLLAALAVQFIFDGLAASGLFS